MRFRVARHSPLVGTVTVLAFLLWPALCAAGLGSWTTSGPAGLLPIPLGHSLAIDRQAPSVLYATSYGTGVFKSTDGGASWTPINSGLPSSLAMAIAVDPTNSSVVYVTMAPAIGIIGGAFKSTDGGATWLRASNGLPSGPIGGPGAEASNLYQALVIDPQNPSVLYAGSGATGSALVYKTQDGGASWTLTNTGLGGSTFAGTIAVDPTNSSVVYVGTTTGGVFKSVDGGATWAGINVGLTDSFTLDLAIDPGTPATLYVGTVTAGLFKSVNGGATWFPANAGLPGGRVNAVVVDPTSPSIVYASASCCGVFKSADRGASWTAMTGSPPAWTLAVSPSGTCVHASATGGVFDFATEVGPCAPAALPPDPTTLVAAVLPSSRAVQVGTTATAFVTILNTGSHAAVDVGISLASPLPAIFKFNRTDCGTNAVVGGDNVPVGIPVGGQACYVISITPTAAFGPLEVAFVFAGTNTPAVATLVGINTLLLLASATPTADAVALAATPPPNDGIVRIPGLTGTGVLAVAVSNVGIGDVLSVSTNTGATSLPVAVSVCETNPVTGACTSAIGPTVTTFVGAGATPTFGVFVVGTGTAIPLDPATNRLFVLFSRLSDGVTVGRTSVAVMTE